MSSLLLHTRPTRCVTRWKVPLRIHRAVISIRVPSSLTNGVGSSGIGGGSSVSAPAIHLVFSHGGQRGDDGSANHRVLSHGGRRDGDDSYGLMWVQCIPSEEKGTRCILFFWKLTVVCTTFLTMWRFGQKKLVLAHRKDEVCHQQRTI
jgi:hypothetical protein